AQQWAAGDSTAGRALWAQFAELGLTGLRVAESDGGFGGSVTDLAIVFERLGYHGVPGPYIESVALLPSLVDTNTRSQIVSGTIATASMAMVAPAALDANAAERLFHIADGTLHEATVSEQVASLAPTRHLTLLTPDADGQTLDAAALAAASDEAALAAAATLLGAGERLLAEAVSYAKVREQFGRPIGEFQALKHQLADIRVALTFARPLVWNAALEFDDTTRERAVSAAKVAASNAAARAARVALQVHGAIGYTSEHHLRIWLGLAQTLPTVWGTSAFHRSRVARAILRDSAA
ncbi:acyl-CoA dehydrogenase family protein, partial [Microbacterium sp.]|uniref:acyl-CoA dehydrogenase family protein n=1 Tax=Microbacterium sp. TaxID=51671 RepID=UPI0026244FAD